MSVFKCEHRTHGGAFNKCGKRLVTLRKRAERKSDGHNGDQQQQMLRGGSASDGR